MKILFAALFMAANTLEQAAAPAQTPPQVASPPQAAPPPAQAAPAQGPPPRNLVRRPDGRFTANEDPTNPERFDVHVVAPGDTLSQIAGRYLNNPRLWPQLWEQNEHIVNPHWIYPNDKILIKPITLITEATPPEPEPAAAPPPPEPERIRPTFVPREPAPPEPEPTPAEAAFRIDRQRPAPEVKPGDMACAGFVQRAQVTADLKVLAKHNADDSALATTSDYVYISQGSEDGVRVGSRYQVIRPTKKLQALGGPRSERDLGTHYLDVAQLGVVLTQPDFSLARVLTNCEPIEIGDPMMAFTQVQVPNLPRPRAFDPFMTTTGDVKGSVVTTKNALSNFGSAFKASGKTPGVRGGRLASLDKGIASAGAIVYIDVGADHGVKSGDLFIVYKQFETDTSVYDNVSEARRLLRNQRTAVAEIVILKVGERAATALVTYGSDAISAGDSVERR